MKKFYIAPEISIVRVKSEGLMETFSVHPGDNNTYYTVEGTPEEVGAKDDIWSGGVSIWED